MRLRACAVSVLVLRHSSPRGHLKVGPRHYRAFAFTAVTFPTVSKKMAPMLAMSKASTMPSTVRTDRCFGRPTISSTLRC